MKLQTLLEGLTIESMDPRAAKSEITSIEIDSRKAKDGALFVCLPGANFDGHDYAISAYQAGCRAFLCEHKLHLPEDSVQIICEDTRALLPFLSANFYDHPARSLKLIGITGTKGKTTTALLLYAILNHAGIPAAYVGTNGVYFNNHRYATNNTTPESLKLHQLFREMVNEKIQAVVMEISSQALTHHRVDGLNFEATAFLNLSNDHIGPNEHKDFSDYAEAKRKLFTEHTSGRIVINADDPYSTFMVKGVNGKVESFSLKQPADYTAKEIKPEKRGDAIGTAFLFESITIRENCWIAMPGDFSVQNALCAIALADSWNLSAAQIREALAEARCEGRFEVISGLKGRTIILDYAHNKTSMEHALNTLRSYHPKRLVVIYGSVGDRTENRRVELGTIASSLADFSIITSDNPGFEDPMKIIEEIAACYREPTSFVTIPDRKEAVLFALNNSKVGDLLLFAGKGHETYQLIQGQKVPFSEKEIIQEYIKNH